MGVIICGSLLDVTAAVASRLHGCIGVIDEKFTRGGGGQVVLVNKRNTITSPVVVVATRIQDRRHVKML